ncbi:hypothetical protein R3W88_010232 [Solanum pinnatisectum]|uniref:F-box domain-containing protein n=1 Tax=Solanum pinnatisectum TaxID=50273 RepID=A0AAV9MD23_9SOLN|nr:hypothetical protein R3W88_010232 [Solanum pinnatisectum]
MSTNSVDPTLRLLDHILNSIFSYLSFHDIVNVRLVTKHWYRNTPYHLSFDESIFLLENKHNMKFSDWILDSLETSKSMLIKAEKRILSIRNLMRLMDENNFHEVYFKLKNSSNYLPYIFQSTYLSVLHLSCCTLDVYVLNGEAKFSSLQELKLDGVRFYGENLSRFISKYPCIRELRLVDCERQWRNFNKPPMFIVLSNLDNLEKLYVKHYDYMRSIQVIAPNLKVFHFVYPSDCNNNAVYMDIRACTMLREFHLDCERFPIGLNEDLCSNFPHLKTFQSLRTLTLFFTKRLEISTPNLSTFKYIGTKYIPCLAQSDSSKLVETRIELLIKTPKINNAWFEKLIIHINNFSNNIVLSLCIWDEITKFSAMDNRGLQWWIPTQLIHHIEHLELDMTKLKLIRHEFFMRFVIDSLLNMSHSKTLTLSISSYFPTLAHGSANRNKCWRHFLKDFEVNEQINKDFDILKFLFKFTWY